MLKLLPKLGLFQSVSDYFSSQARRTPWQLAIEDDNYNYTYEQLETLTNQLAHYFQQLGVGPERVVGCHLVRSTAITIFCLSILKAGGTYLLIDPNLPLARRHYMIDDANPQFIISDVSTDLSVTSTRVIAVQKAYQEAVLCPNTSVEHCLTPKNAAYIAYTSGSTGQPKGVVITHEALVNHALYFARQFKLSSKDRVPLISPIAFDMATEEMIPPLVAGCTLVVARSIYTDMAEFTAEIQNKSYTILNIPAPLWHEWSEYMCVNSAAIPSALRLIIAGSDKIHTSSYAQWSRLPKAKDVTWVAAYGTTETTVTSTFYLTAAIDDLSDESVMPIGKPIANTKAYILDDSGYPVPKGEVGELHISGLGVARGYLNLPNKTAARFVPDKFSKEASVRVYKTGDLARFRQDGTIVCLGRKDFQVKIRGLRIELGEIEITLEALPAITNAVVVLCHSSSRENSKRLVAFITTGTATKPPSSASILAALREKLHAYMVPHHIRWLSAMPLNATGKIDRKFLQSYAEELISQESSEAIHE